MWSRYCVCWASTERYHWLCRYKVDTTNLYIWMEISLQYIEKQNGGYFAKTFSKCIFLTENVSILIENLLKYVSEALIDIKSALVHVMAWCHTCDNPLPKPNVDKVSWRHMASPNHNHLTHWDRVTHICINKLTIIGSDNGLVPNRHQAIIWINAGLLLIGPLEQTSVKS